jgi:hypothetical protein
MGLIFKLNFTKKKKKKKNSYVGLLKGGLLISLTLDIGRWIRSYLDTCTITWTRIIVSVSKGHSVQGGRGGPTFAPSDWKNLSPRYRSLVLELPQLHHDR